MNTENIELFTQNSIRIMSDVGKIYIDPFRINKETHDADFVFDGGTTGYDPVVPP